MQQTVIPCPKEMAFLQKAGLSPSRAHDFAMANQVLKNIEKRLSEGATLPLKANV